MNYFQSHIPVFKMKDERAKSEKLNRRPHIQKTEDRFTFFKIHVDELNKTVNKIQRLRDDPNLPKLKDLVVIYEQDGYTVFIQLHQPRKPSQIGNLFGHQYSEPLKNVRSLKVLVSQILDQQEDFYFHAERGVACMEDDCLKELFEFFNKVEAELMDRLIAEDEYPQRSLSDIQNEAEQMDEENNKEQPPQENSKEKTVVNEMMI